MTFRKESQIVVPEIRKEEEVVVEEVANKPDVVDGPVTDKEVIVICAIALSKFSPSLRRSRRSKGKAPFPC